MRPVGIVVHPPFFDQPASGRQVAEHVLVETFVAEATVQALDEPVLHRLAWHDVMPLDLAILLPLQDCPPTFRRSADQLSCQRLGQSVGQIADVAEAP